MSFGGFGIAAETTPAMTPPVIAGTLRIGRTVAAIFAGGSSWQWRVADDDSGTNEADISGATNETYLIDEGDVSVDQYIQVVVDGTESSAWYGPVGAQVTNRFNNIHHLLRA
jgi:hypothetical protein